MREAPPRKAWPPEHLLGKSVTFRVLEGVRIWQQIPVSTLIMLSAGCPGYLSQAEIYTEAALELGVPAAHLDIVPTPKTTYEESVHFQEKFKVILVTPAMHMRRAKSLFESQGLEVVPTPCHFVSLRHPDDTFRLPWPRAEALEFWGLLLHEGVVMIVLGY